MPFGYEEEEVPFLTIMFQGLPWKNMFTSFEGFLTILQELQVRYNFYDRLVRSLRDVPDDLSEEEYSLSYALDDELYDYIYYKGWTETIPMVLTYIMFLTGSYWIGFFIIVWSYDEVSDYYINEFHADNLDENEPPDPDEMESPAYEPSFFFYDIHTYDDYDLLYHHYINRFRKIYKF